MKTSGEVRAEIESIDAAIAALVAGQRPDNPWAKHLRHAQRFVTAALGELPEPPPADPGE